MRACFKAGSFTKMRRGSRVTILSTLAAIGIMACSDAPGIQDTVTEKASEIKQKVTEPTVPDMLQYSSELASYLGLEYGDTIDVVKSKIAPDFSKRDSVEGEADYAISVVLLDTGNAVMRATAKNLPDDSLKSQQLAAIFVSQGDNEPQLTEYGLRIKCWRAADPDAWTTQLCP